MTEIIIALIACGTVGLVSTYAYAGFSAYLDRVHPEPIDKERFKLLEKTVRRHDAHLKSQGMRTNG